MTSNELEKALFDLFKRAEDGGLSFDEITEAVRQEMRWQRNMRREDAPKPYVAPLSPFASTV